MNNVLLVIVLLIGLYGVIVGVLNKNKLYRYPFLFSSILLSFSVPQIIGLNISNELPSYYLTRLLLVILTCQVAVFSADYFVKRPTKLFQNWKYSYSSLIKLSIVLSLVGSFFFFLISRLPEELTNSTQWTGLPVLYLFFSHLLTYGFAIAVWLTVYNKKFFCIPFYIALYDAMFYFDRIIIAGRRAVAAEFILIIALSYWFHRRSAPKSWQIIIGLIATTLVMHSIGEYRSNSITKSENPYANISSINYVDNLNKLLDKGGVEMKNAAYLISATANNSNYDYGLSHWNNFVFSYVPAQLVGKNVKSFLMIKLTVPSLDNENYSIHTGSTLTGFSDSFMSFGYFGFIKFFFIGCLMASLYKSAMGDNATIQLIYMLLVTDSMHTVTHSTHHMIAEIPHILVFLILPLWFAKSKKIH